LETKRQPCRGKERSGEPVFWAQNKVPRGQNCPGKNTRALPWRRTLWWGIVSNSLKGLLHAGGDGSGAFRMTPRCAFDRMSQTHREEGRVWCPEGAARFYCFFCSSWLQPVEPAQKHRSLRSMWGTSRGLGLPQKASLRWVWCSVCAFLRFPPSGRCVSFGRKPVS